MLDNAADLDLDNDFFYRRHAMLAQ